MTRKHTPTSWPNRQAARLLWSGPSTCFSRLPCRPPNALRSLSGLRRCSSSPRPLQKKPTRRRRITTLSTKRRSGGRRTRIPSGRARPTRWRSRCRGMTRRIPNTWVGSKSTRTARALSVANSSIVIFGSSSTSAMAPDSCSRSKVSHWRLSKSTTRRSPVSRRRSSTPRRARQSTSWCCAMTPTRRLAPRRSSASRTTGMRRKLREMPRRPRRTGRTTTSSTRRNKPRRATTKSFGQTTRRARTRRNIQTSMLR
mmetsp:Transcript_4979/g.10962  ORF Transcript_4979/g.10962 Transcript_4979/m.10962 type:complete len:255 (-) Transcript_4979:437-1201(-)